MSVVLMSIGCAGFPAECVRGTRRGRLARLASAAIAAAFALSLSAESGAAQPERPPDVPADKPFVEFYMGEVLVGGWVMRVAMDEETFDFYDAMGRARIPNIPLAQLPPTDRTRLRRWAGAEESGLGEEWTGFRPTGGDEIDATKYFLKSGRQIVGLELGEMSTKLTVYIRTKYAPVFSIPRDQIGRAEPVRARETEIYSLDELYRERSDRIDPESGGDNYELAEYLRRIGHYVRARDHYRRAMLLDPRIETQAKERLAEIETIIQAEVVQRLDKETHAHYRAGRYCEALAAVERLGKVDPRSSAYLKWMGRAQEIEEKLLQNLRREVVGSYYRKMDELIRKRVWGRVLDGPSIPWKIVETASGAYTGRFVDEDDQYMTLDRDGRQIRIDKSMIRGTPMTFEGNKKRREATYAESQEYVTDTEGGLTADILGALAEQYGKLIIAYKASQAGGGGEAPGDTAADAPLVDDIFGPPETAESAPGEGPAPQVEAVPHEEIEEAIKSYWEGRLKDVVEVTRYGTKRTAPVAALHEASWGTGSWLREGSTPVAVSDYAKMPDPKEWWKSLEDAREVRYQILRAMAAEALCKVEKEIKIKCSNCGGRGVVTTCATSSQVGLEVCPACKGTRFVIKIKYR